MRLRGFVPVEELQRDGPPIGDQEQSAVPAFIAEPLESWETRTSLFGDAE